MRFFVLLLLTIFTDFVYACKCVSSTLVERIDGAEAVIIGQVNKLQLEENTHSTASVAVGYELLDTLKGDVSDLSVFKIELNSCGIDYKIGRDYLILVGRDGLTHTCLGAVMLFPWSQMENHPETVDFLIQIDQYVKGEINMITPYDDPLLHLNKSTLGGLDYSNSKLSETNQQEEQ